ncbi:MAG: MarR family winged helix-turn-helix transcriptional regulator [Pseudomonadota bacterium]
MSEPARDNFVAALFNARNRIRFAMDDAFRPLGITDATWRTLFFLEQEGNGVSQKRLATTMGIEGPSLVRLLDNLEERGLIERQISKEDRRKKLVHLTKKAEELLIELHEVATETRQAILARVSDAELKTCLRVFDHILAAADKRD